MKACRGIGGIPPLILEHTRPFNSNREISTLNIPNTNSNMLCKFVAVYAMKACSGNRGKAPLILYHTFLFDTTR